MEKIQSLRQLIEELYMYNEISKDVKDKLLDAIRNG